MKRTNLSIRLTDESGATTALFVAVLLPFLFILLSISMDISTYYTHTRNIQRILDEAAIFGQQFLPNKDAAQNAVQSILSEKQVDLGSIQVSISTDKVELSYSGTQEYLFAQLLNVEASPEVRASATARTSVQDVILFLDNSSYLAPSLYNAASWGSPLYWPAASFFQNEYRIHYNDPDGITHTVDANAATQQCFNPYFSALKQAAVTLYQHFSSSRLNATGLIFGPDAAGLLHIGRPASPQPVAGQPGKARFTSYRGLHMRGDLCMAAAERELNTQHYRFPARTNNVNDMWTPPAGAPVHRVNPADWQYDQNYNDFLRGEELIWGQSAATQGVVDIKTVIETVIAAIVTAPTISSRGGLMNHQQRLAFILLGDLPHLSTGQRYPHLSVEQSVSSSLAKAQQQILNSGLSLKLVFIVLDKANSPAPVETISNLTKLIESFEMKDNQAAFSPRLYFANSPAALNQVSLSLLASGERRAVLSK